MTNDQLTPQGEERLDTTQEATNATPTPDAPSQPTPEASAEAPAVSNAADDSTPATPAPDDSKPSEEALADAPEQAQQTDAELFEQALASLEGGEESNQNAVGAASISRGERIEAEVILVEKERVFVNLGTKAEGVLPLNELTDNNVTNAADLVKVGDRFDVVVLKTGAADSNPVVSKKRADFDVAWKNILDSFEEGEVFQAQVVDRVKGGLVVDIGVRGFVPATHVGSGKLRNIEKYVGETLPVKIIEVDRERRKVVLSNRVAEDEKREEVKDQIFTDMKPQDTVEGVVRRLTDYGAFVDLGGIDGLLHISEMSWVRIDHPREVLKEGEKIKVMVLRLDKDSGRISLGLRQVLPDPWNLIRKNYKVGEKIKVIVGRMVQSGVFVKLPEGAEAFLPLSEVSNERIKRPEDVLTQDQEIEPMIIDLRPDERRMVLSLRDGISPADFTDFRQGGRGRGGRGGGRPGGRGGRRMEQQADFEQSAGSRQAPTQGATIGERLGALRGFFRDASESEGEEAKPKESKAESKKAEAKKSEEPQAEQPKTESPVTENVTPEPAEKTEEKTTE